MYQHVCGIQVSKDHAAVFCQELKYNKPNMRFIEGHIEYLDKAEIADESVDMIISNCVVNLSPNKRRVLQEAYRVLAKGGEFYFSDVYCDRRLPQHVKDNQVGPLACVMLDIHHSPHQLSLFGFFPACTFSPSLRKQHRNCKLW